MKSSKLKSNFILKDFLQFASRSVAARLIMQRLFGFYSKMMVKLNSVFFMFVGVYFVSGAAAAESRGDGLGIKFVNHTLDQITLNSKIVDSFFDFAFIWILSALFLLFFIWICEVFSIYQDYKEFPENFN